MACHVNLRTSSRHLQRDWSLRGHVMFCVWLLATLTHSLESSGLDLSQASISVQINLGKRAKRPGATTTSSAKELEDPSSGNRAMGHSMVGSSGEEFEQASKRHKPSNNS